jgi:GR25 family glycosyltransferase involved in LPS biosynthesis
MKLKTVVISLQQEKEKDIFIKKEMEKCNLSDYIIIDGVDGSNITEIPIITNSNKPIISKLVYNGKTIIYDSRLRLNGSGLNKKEMGSTLSHLYVYNMLLNDDEYDAYLVFEDDAKLSVSVDELKIFLDELKSNTFDICHISTDFNKLKRVSENYWIPEKNKFFNNNTNAYIVSKAGAGKLLTATYMCIGLPAIDLISTLYIYSDDFNVIVSSKFLFNQNNFEKVNIKQKVISMKDFGIWARLGNQMFQYAYLRTLSIEKGFKIKLPINRSGHGYKNPHFFDAFDLPFLDISNTPFSNFHTIYETSLLFDEKLTSEYISEKENIMFDGYFQCEKYFKKYEDIIRSDFTFKENIRINGNIFMENIKKTVGSIKLVALHVRRADNLLHNSPTVLITDTFRNNAINFLSDKIGSYHILIFSDDKKWCSEHLNYKGINQTVVDGLSDIEEMYVMSLCDHFIVGSSTYSWWSAWLSCNKDKIIIAPDKWFSGILGRGKPLCEQEKDLIPSEWIRLNM